MKRLSSSPQILIMLSVLKILSFLATSCSDPQTNIPPHVIASSRTVDDINLNIKGLQFLLTAQDEGRSITSCTTVSDSEYQIETEDGNSFGIKTALTLTGDKVEYASYSPCISVQRQDGAYYWTIDGNFLLHGGKKVKVTSSTSPLISIANGYWTLTYEGTDYPLAKAEDGRVRSVFTAVTYTDDEAVIFHLRGSLEDITLKRRLPSEQLIQPTATLRRIIDPNHPAWIIHIDVRNNADPQAIIDLIPQDIRPYVIFNISLSVSKDVDGHFNKPIDGYRTAKSWLSICAANQVWAMVQASSGGACHWPDYDTYENIQGSLFEEFYQKYPNFIGFNYAEQGWGFGTDENYLKRLKHFSNLLRLSHDYGGYLVVSFFLPSYASKNSGVAIIKRSPELAEACLTYGDNFITCEKFTQTNSFHEMESTSLGVFLSGYAGHYGIRFDQCGWGEGNDGLAYWNNEKTFQPAAGAIPVIEHLMLTGQTVMDGPELIWKQCFEESDAIAGSNGYSRRTWKRMEQFEQISMDVFRKIIDGTIRLLTRREVIQRTKVVVVNDLAPTGATQFDAGYSAPATLFQGLYLLDEDGIQSHNRFWFKKTGRYPAIPTVARLADAEAQSFAHQLKASQFQDAADMGNIEKKQQFFNHIFPEEYTGNGMFAARLENAWVVYNCYAQPKTATIPFKYNTADSLKLEFGKYSTAVIKEFHDKIDLYLTNYTSNRKVVTDIIRIYGCTAKPHYTLNNRIAGNTSTITDEWRDNVLTLRVKHNGAVDIQLHCSGKATHRETDYTVASIAVPHTPQTYKGMIQYEAEHFEYKHIGSIYKDAASSSGTLTGFTGMGYLDMGRQSDAAVREVITAIADGTYSIKIRYNTSTTIQAISLFVNNELVSTPTFSSTNDKEWQTISVGVMLHKGSNTIELRANHMMESPLLLDYITVNSIE